MKNSNAHAILSEIHRMLSQYTLDDFAAAANYTGVSEAMRAALSALVREAGHSNQQIPKGASLKDAPGGRPDAKRPPSVGRARTRDEIVEAIRRSRQFASSRTILEYAAALGLSIKANPKDGKDRLAGRLAEAIDSSPEPKRSQLLAELDRERGNQTQGWIDVIKSARA